MRAVVFERKNPSAPQLMVDRKSPELGLRDIDVLVDVPVAAGGNGNRSPDPVRGPALLFVIPPLVAPLIVIT